MKRAWQSVGVALGIMSMTGCLVGKAKYQDAVAEAEAAKTELATTRAQKSALEQQVKTLKELNVKFGNEAQAANDELERIQHGRDKERGAIETRTKELEDRVKQLTTQNRSVRAEYEDAKRHNETLKSLVARYQKELKERSVTGTLAPTSPASNLHPAGVPAPPSMGASVAPTGLMNVNKATAGDMVLVLGITKDMAERIVSNRPYKVKGELVAKNVVPKETFDMIRERISVSP